MKAQTQRQNRQYTAFLSLLALSLIAMACEPKKKDPVFEQGVSMDGMHLISTHQNTVYPIETKEPLLEEDFLKSRNVSILPYESEKSEFEFVKYDTTAPFLKDLDGSPWPLLARPKTKDVYSFVFQLTDKQLVVYKKASGHNLSKNEKSFAHSIDKGDHFLVPQFSLSIELFTVEEAQDISGQKLGFLKKFQKQKLSEASYFKPKLETLKIANSADREYAFPVSYFTKSDWFFSATVVQSAEIPEGLSINADFEYQEASRIKFVLEQTRLTAKNLNIDAVVAGQDDKARAEIQMQDVMYIPATPYDIVKESAPPGEVGLSEKYSTARPWQKRNYVHLDLKAAYSVASNFFKSGISNDANLISYSFDDKSLNFTVFYTFQKQMVRYSFRRAHTPIENPRFAIGNDIEEHFGFFTTDKAFIPGAEHVRLRDYQTNTFINRFYPENSSEPGKIIFRFSHNSQRAPELFKEAAREAIEQWNRAFQLTGYSVELKEDFTTDIGDIRYNTINLIYEEKGTMGLLGYGPSVADTKSGEIISATTNLYVAPFQQIAINQLRSLLYKEIGMIKDEKILSPTEYISSLSERLSSYGHKSEPLDYLMSRDQAILSRDIPVSAEISEEVAARINSCKSMKIALEETIRESQEKCQDDFYAYIKDLRALNKGRSIDEILTHDPENAGREIEVLRSCAQKLIRSNVVSTMLHELGHNFGLRHNFAASADIRNFSREARNAREAREKARSSSVMDYLSPSVKDQDQLGPYDIAAIMYGYKGVVELESDESLSKNIGGFTNKWTPVYTKENTDELALKPTESIADFQKRTRFNARKYRFCNDDQVTDYSNQGLKFSKEPLCFRFDAGGTATEIADHLIHNLNNSMSTGRHRFDYLKSRYKSSETMAAHLTSYYLAPLLRIYTEWRRTLAIQMKDFSKINLLGLTVEELENEFKRGSLLVGREREKFFDYLGASELIWEAVLKLSALPAKHCLVMSGDEIQATFDFEHLKAQAALNGEQIRDCQDTKSRSLMGISSDTVVTSVGFNYEDHTFSTEVANRPDWWTADIVGVKDLVSAAQSVMVSTDVFTKDADQARFYPVLMQDPRVIRRSIDLLEERILFGVRKSDLITVSEDQIKSRSELTQDDFLLLFKAMDNSTLSLASSISNALDKNSKNSSINKWRIELSFKLASGVQNLPDTALIYTPGIGGLRYAEAQNSKAYMFIQKYNQLNNLRTLLAELERLRKSLEQVQSETTELLKRYPFISQALTSKDSWSEIKADLILTEARALFAQIRSRADLLAFFRVVLAPLSQSAQGSKVIFEGQDLSQLSGQSLNDFLISTQPERIPHAESLGLNPVSTDFSIDETLKKISLYSQHARELEAQEMTIEKFFNGSGFGSW